MKEEHQEQLDLDTGTVWLLTEERSHQWFAIYGNKSYTNANKQLVDEHQT